MPGREEPSQEIRLPISDDNEEELHSMSYREIENFRSFRALKESSNDNSTLRAQSSKPKPLIRRVPSTLISENKDRKKYFEPRVVAIGPLHHGSPRLQPAERTKLELAVLFTKKSGVREQVLYQKIKGDIEYLKKCYRSEDIEDYDEEELAWMFFVDGCAVLHTIYCIQRKTQKSLNIKVDLLVFAQVDMFMLENQLPIRVLELLISSVSVDEGNDLRESIRKFIDENIKKAIAAGKEQAVAAGKKQAVAAGKKQAIAAGKEQPPSLEEEHHLLGLLRKRLLANHKPNNNNKSSTAMEGHEAPSIHEPAALPKKIVRSINEMKEAGIHVSPSETSGLRDVKFNVRILATLEFPRIVVDDSTGSKFMNLIAYEMCPDFDNDFEVTSYLCFLDSLIDTAQDVKELRHAGMLLNCMGSDEEVADLFNKITTDLVPDVGMYGRVTEEILNYCNNQWRTSIAKAYYTHFSTPWSIVGFLGALMGLIFTAIQSYYSIKRNID